jgi:hypothetical protein
MLTPRTQRQEQGYNALLQSLANDVLNEKSEAAVDNLFISLKRGVLNSRPAFCEEVEVSLRVFKLMWNVRQDIAVDIGSELALLEKAETHWMYPVLLAWALDGDIAVDEMLTRSRDILHDSFGNDSKVQFSTPLQFLFVAFLRRTYARSDSRLLAEAIDLFHQGVRRSLRRAGMVDLAMNTYNCVFDVCEGSFTQYGEEYANWVALRIEHTRAGLLNQIVKDGQFFGALQNIVDATVRFRIPIVERDHELCLNIMRGEESLGKMFDTPVDADRLVLIVNDGARSSISRDFLLLGKTAYDPDFNDRAKIDEWRHGINETTKREIYNVLEVICGCASVPPVIRDVIREHRNDLRSLTDDVTVS